MKMEKNRKRAWLWVVTPILFLIIGAGVFFGLRHFLKEKPNVRMEPGISDSSKVDENLDGNTTEEDGSETSGGDAEEKPSVKIELEPSPFNDSPKSANGTISSTTYNAVAHEIDGVKYVYYKTAVWGTVEADFNDFRVKVAETLNDARGWARAGLRFVEVSEGQDLNIILSDPASLDGYNGYCSNSLSCTSGYNEVIINDVRWRQGTDVTTGSGAMNIRDYQHMVVNHEVGHWLGHYQHIDTCAENGGVAPIMLQQSTGLRNCGTFNPWPLDDELWILR